MKELGSNSISNSPIPEHFSRIETDLDQLGKTFDSLGKLESGKPIVYSKGSGDPVGTFKSRADAVQSKTHHAGEDIISRAKQYIKTASQTFSGTFETDNPLDAVVHVENQVKILHDQLFIRKDRLSLDQLKHCLNTLNVLKKKLPQANAGIEVLSRLMPKASSKQMAAIAAGISDNIKDMETFLTDHIRTKQIKKIPQKRMTKAGGRIEHAIGKRKEAVESFEQLKGSMDEKISGARRAREEVLESFEGRKGRMTEKFAGARQAREEARETFARRRGDIDQVSEKIVAKQKEILLRKQYGPVLEELKSKNITLRHVEPPVEKRYLAAEEEVAEESAAPEAPVAGPKGAPPPPLPPPPMMGPRKSAEELAIERRITSRFGDTGQFYTLSKAAEEKIKAKAHDIDLHENFVGLLNSLPDSVQKKNLINSEKDRIDNLHSDIEETAVSGKVGVDLNSAKEKFSKYFTDELYMILGAYYTGEHAALALKKERLEELTNQLKEQMDAEAVDPEDKDVLDRKRRNLIGEANALENTIAIIKEAINKYQSNKSPEKKVIFEKMKKDWDQVLKLSGNMMTAILSVIQDRKLGNADEPPPDTQKARGAATEPVKHKKQGAVKEPLSLEEITKKRTSLKKTRKEPDTGL